MTQLAVAVNKLDTVNWSQERFMEIKTSLRHFLKTVGFKDADVIYVPCSGLSGENLVKPSMVEALNSWYTGPTLLQAIGKFREDLVFESNWLEKSWFMKLIGI